MFVRQKEGARIKGFLPKMIFERGHGIAGGEGGERYIAGMMHWFLMVYGEGGDFRAKGWFTKVSKLMSF
jgi:hypothetical protein